MKPKDQDYIVVGQFTMSATKETIRAYVRLLSDRGRLSPRFEWVRELDRATMFPTWRRAHNAAKKFGGLTHPYREESTIAARSAA